MSRQLIVSTKFTAIDKFSKVVTKMRSGVDKFVNKADVGLARVERAERKMRNGFKKSLGLLGRLGLGFTALMIAQMAFSANVELDSKLANLQAITGVTTEVFKGFELQIERVSKSQKRFAGDTADAFTIVGSAQPELLKSADALAKVTEAAIILSKASRDDLTLSAQNVTGAMNQFNLKANESFRVINVLSAGSKEGAANITEINESLTKFGAVANASNISIEESVGLIEVLASKSIKGSDAGTMLRASIVNLKKAGVGYQSGLFNMKDALQDVNDRLLKLGTAKKKDAYLNKIFGKTGITAGQILVDNTALYDKLTVAVTGTNIAQEQAAINSNTIQNRLDELINSFKNAVTSTDKENESLTSLKNILKYAADNMDKIISATKTAIGIFILYKTIMIATKTSIIAYNVAIGIMGAVTGVANIAIGKSKIALMAYNVATKIAAASQWLLNIAMDANPIGLIIIGIAALIGLIIAIALHWDTWGKKIIKYMGPLGILIDAVIFFAEEWNSIVLAFKSEGILGGLKRIGQAILRYMIRPITEAADLLAKIGIVNEGAGDKIIRKLGLADDQITMAPKEKINPEASTLKAQKNKETNSYLHINNNTGYDAKLESNLPNVNLTNSMAF